MFGGVIREDRSVLELLDADYTFVNERLARHYGIEGVVGRSLSPSQPAEGQPATRPCSEKARCSPSPPSRIALLR